VSQWTRRGVIGATAGGLLAACGPGENPVPTTPPEPVEADDPFPELVDQSGSVSPITLSELGDHRRRMAALLKAADIDALVIEPSKTMTWLSGVRWGRSERLFALVLLADGKHFWMCPAFEAEKAKRKATGRILAWDEHEYAFEPLAAALRERGAERIAVEPTIRYFAVAGLEAAIGRRVLNGNDIVLDARGHKDLHEQKLMRRACELTQDALEAASKRVEVGMTGADIGAMVSAAQRKLGLTGVWQLSLIGPDAAFPHGADQSRPVAKGDVILVDTGGDLHGYQSDITRTWVLGGEPTAEVSKVWTAVRDAQKHAFDAMKPGVRAGDIDRIARESIEKSGFGSGYANFTHRLGHGIGMRGHEGPYLDGGNDRPLEVGNTFSDEPGIYLYGKFGVRIEDIVVITEDGADHFGDWQPGPTAIR